MLALLFLALNRLLQQNVAYGESRFVCATDQHHFGAHHFADYTRKVGIVGAAQQQRVDARVAHGCQQSFGEHRHFISCGLVSFYKLDEAGASSRGKHDIGFGLSHRLHVGTRRNCADCSNHANFVVVRYTHECASAWFDNAHYGHW